MASDGLTIRNWKAVPETVSLADLLSLLPITRQPGMRIYW